MVMEGAKIEPNELLGESCEYDRDHVPSAAPLKQREQELAQISLPHAAARTPAGIPVRASAEHADHPVDNEHSYLLRRAQK